MIRVRQLGPREIDARIRNKQPMLAVFVPAEPEKYQDGRCRVEAAQYAVLEESIISSAGVTWIEAPFTQD